MPGRSSSRNDASADSRRAPAGKPARSKAQPKPSLETYVARRQRNRRLVVAGIVTCLLALILADRASLLLYDGSDWSAYHNRQVRVVAVVDGDTIDVGVRDGERPTTRVRLWGVNSPELAHDERPAQPWAHEARDMTQSLVLDEVVTLQLEPHQVRGRYGRLVAYVQLSDGTYLGQRLLVAGLARADDRFSHRWLERYELLQHQAETDRVGIWSDPPEQRDEAADADGGNEQ